MSTITPVFEPVVVVADYMDCILSGVAYFNEEPCVFLAQKGRSGDAFQRYTLHSIPDLKRTLALENQDLWKPTVAIRKLVDFARDEREGQAVLGEFREVGPSSTRGPEAMEVRWHAA